jgi:hypothetical protein
VFLGADIDSLTFYHYLEEAEEARLPTSPFTRETFALTTRLPDGSVLPTSTRLFEPAVSRRRDLAKLVPELRHAGAWHEARLGWLRIIVIEARAVHEAFLRLADRGVFCYG